MEVYRTNGNEKIYDNERLIDLVYSLRKTDYFFPEVVDRIVDHKGCLMVCFNNNFEFNKDYYFSLFIYHWVKANEVNLEFYFEKNLIKEFSL